MSSFTTRTTTADRHHLYRLTNGILNAHSLHFIPISLIFIPLTLTASSTVNFYLSSTFENTSVTTMFDPFNLFLIKTLITFSHNLLHVRTLITILTITCSVILPTVAGVAIITFNTNQIINHKPITFSSTVKSLSNSYIPLIYTFIAGSIKLTLLFLVFTLLPLAITEAIESFGFHFFFSVFINTISSFALVITILFFITIWGSAPAITVLESKSGFEALHLSANQSTEFRHHSFSIVFVTGFGVGTALAYSTVEQTFGPFLILQVGSVCLQSSLMILLYVVANAVLYVQSKVTSGDEIVMKMVDGEVSGEHVRLVGNDNDDVFVHELAKDEKNGGFSYMCYLLIMVSVILFCQQMYNLYVLVNNI